MTQHVSRETASTPAVDRAPDVLRRRHQRWILLGLREGAVERLSDLTMRGTGEGDVRAELEREHLPKLEEAGYIEWDRDTGEISKGPYFHEIERFLRLLENQADSQD